MYLNNKEDEIFLQRIIRKLTPNDIYILHALREKTTPQLGLTRDEIKSDTDKSDFNIFLSINRLELVDLIDTLKVGKTNQYSISDLGIRVLEILSNE